MFWAEGSRRGRNLMAEPQAEQWTATDPVYLNRAHQTHRHPNLGGRGLRAHDGRRAQVAGRAHRGVASDPQSRAGPGRHRLPGRQRPSPRPGASRRAGAGCSGRGGPRTGCPVPRGPLPGEVRPLAAVGHPRSLRPRWPCELAAALLLRCLRRACHARRPEGPTARLRAGAEDGRGALLGGADGLPYLSRYDGLMSIRITPLGASALGIATDIEVPAPVTTPVLQVLPDLQVVAVGVEVDRSVRMALDAFGVPVSDVVWRIDHAKLLAAGDQGWSIEQIRTFLTAHSVGALPETVSRLLQDVAERSGQVVDPGPGPPGGVPGPGAGCAFRQGPAHRQVLHGRRRPPSGGPDILGGRVSPWPARSRVPPGIERRAVSSVGAGDSYVVAEGWSHDGGG